MKSALGNAADKVEEEWDPVSSNAVAVLSAIIHEGIRMTIMKELAGWAWGCVYNIHPWKLPNDNWVNKIFIYARRWFPASWLAECYSGGSGPRKDLLFRGSEIFSVWPRQWENQLRGLILKNNNSTRQFAALTKPRDLEAVTRSRKICIRKVFLQGEW